MVFHCNGAKSNRHSIGGNFKAGKTKQVKVNLQASINDIEQIEVWIERPPDNADVKWFVDHMLLKTEDGSPAGFFPFHRWVTMKHTVSLFHCSKEEKETPKRKE